MKILFPLVAALAAGILLWSCSVASAPTTAPTVPKSTAAPVTKAAPGQDWDTVIAEAKKEGTVAVYALWRPETREALVKAFKDKYGINVEFSPFSRGPELLAKVQAEQRAGLYLSDVFGVGAGTLISNMKPEGVLGPIEPVLVLPEVLDPKVWSGGKFPYVDKDKTSVGMIASMQRFLMYNTDLVKKGELTSYKDLLKPQYKGQITMNDPAVTGVGNAFLTFMALDVWNPSQTKDYFRQLITQQDLVIQRDNRTHVETVARGKYSIGLAPNPDNMADFLKLGAPIDALIVPEGTFVTPAAGGIGIPTKFAHPNAAKLFVNWVLTKEGATVFSKGFGNPSLRTDVSTEGFNPMFLPKPGEKLFFDTEESLVYRGEMLTIAQQIINETSK